MIEMTLYGRGGQGGVTLAKLIASTYFNRGKHVQAFGVYAAERSGAPLQAYVRIDDAEITNHNQVRTPDHVIVLDRTLIAPNILDGLKPDGWIILNTPQPPEAFTEMLAGRNVAALDATSIAVAHGLGTRTVPIVNTTLLGAVAKVLGMTTAPNAPGLTTAPNAQGLTFKDVTETLAQSKFGGPNLEAAKEAFESVRMAKLPGTAASPKARPAGAPVKDMLDEGVGGMPAIRTGNWATRQPQRHELTPPCNHACPAGNDIQAFVQALQRNDSTEALSILLETTPLPGVCGRVCPAPCMDACNRRIFDESVNIRDLERYAADHGEWPAPTTPGREERVGVVGSGPAGLAAAYHLARLGYPVTLFDANKELGGVLRTGIPAYRLPRDVLDREIRHVLRHGVEPCQKRVTRADLVEMSRRFAAIFMATGLQDVRGLDLGPEADGRVIEGLDFLDRARRAEETAKGQEVIVVGGGNTAMDAARTALRLGARHVRIVYRRSREEMPAIREEIEEALEEGVALDELVQPLRIFREKGATMLTCQRMKLAEPDADGRRRSVPHVGEDCHFDLRCDRVILALGQSADVSILPEGAEVHEGKALVGMTSSPVFFGGDFSNNEGTVSAAIGSGHRAALHIHRTLTGEDLFPTPPPVAGPEQITMHIFEHAPKHDGRSIPPAARRVSFEEVRRGFVDDPVFHPAEDEANRCFSCGVCNLCDRCVHYCPEGVLLRCGEEFHFDYGQCKGCGVCASVCPRGVVYMTEL